LTNIITGKVIYKEKEKENRDFLKYYTYIIIRSFSQISGKNFTETFMLVAKFTTLCIHLALVAYFDWNLEQINIVTVFLNRKLKEEIYMRVLKEF